MTENFDIESHRQVITNKELLQAIKDNKSSLSIEIFCHVILLIILSSISIGLSSMNLYYH